MCSYQELKSNYESFTQKTKKIHKQIYFSTFAILVTSFVISRSFLHIFKGPSLFLFSSFWILIAGLPLLGFQLKKWRTLDHQVSETILQGLNLEISKKSGNYFIEKANCYKKRRQFLLMSLPVWCLSILIIGWCQVILKASGSRGSEYFQNMTFFGCCFGFLAINIYFFSSGPYRKFQSAIKNIRF